MLLIRSRRALTVVVGSALRKRGFVVRATTSNRRKLHGFFSLHPSILITSIVVPHVSNFRVIHHVQRASGRAPMLFLATHSTVGSIIRKFRLNTGSCLGGPFKVRRLVVHVGTLMNGTFSFARRGPGRAAIFRVNSCHFGSIARQLTFTNAPASPGTSARIRLSRHRSRVLGHLYRGHGRIIGARGMLLSL